MARTETLHINIDEAVRENAETTLSMLGISIDEAVNIFLKQVNYTQGFPFDVKLPPPPSRLVVKNDAELLAKLEEADAYAESGHFSTPEEVFERLGRKYGLHNKNVG
jgi:addiction module RelB/DinJ family antitoxin